MAAAALLCAGGAQAAVCTASAVGVAFGIYDLSSSSPNDSKGSVTVQCTGLLEVVTYHVYLSKGNGPNYLNRYLLSGADQLPYNLYTDSARQPAQIWGDALATNHKTGSFTFVVILTPTQQSISYDIFGRIPALQDVPPGTYSDTITVTVTY